MTRTVRSLLALVCLAVPAASMSAQQTQQDTLRLSLEDALRMAREQNPAYLATRNNAEVDDWSVREAYGALLPSASLDGTISWQGAGDQRFGSLTLAANQPAYYLSNYNIGLSYALDGSRLLGPSAARARRAASAADIRAAEMNLRASVTKAYLEVLRRIEAERITAQQLEASRFNLRLARGQQEVGAVTPLDARRAEVEEGRAEIALLQASNARETARLRLLQQIGIDVDRPVALTTTFVLQQPQWSRDTLLALAMAQNPTLASREAAVRAGEVGVRQARTAYLPTLSARFGLAGYTREASDANYLIQQAQASVASQVQSCVIFNEIYKGLTNPLPTRDCSAIAFTDAQRNQIVSSNAAFPFNFTGQPASASLTLSLPVFSGLGRERQLESAKVAREDAELQAREQRIALAADLTITLRAVTTAYQSAMLEEKNRTLADEQLRLAQERYRVGAISIVELVDAETTKAEADQSYVNAVFAYHDAVTDLESVVGADLR